MEKVITRSWVNKNFELHSDTSSSTYSDLIKLIDRWKIILVTKYRVTPGKKIGFTVGITDLRYFSLFFAAAELGMPFVVYQRPMKDIDLHNYKIDVFSPIDIMIIDESTEIDPLCSKFANIHSRTVIHLKEIDSWVNIEDPVNREIAAKIFSNPSDTFLLTTSSGSTDVPKIITHTHEFFYDLCSRNSEVMGFTETDSIMHIRNLHHGSSVSVFFLPSLKKCSYHSYLNFDENEIQDAIKHLIRFRVTKLCVPYNTIIDELFRWFKITNLKVTNLEIYNLASFKKDWIYECHNGIIKSISSIFGCNETGGPIFLPSMNINTKEDFDKANMGKLLDDFYEVKIQDGKLYVLLKTYDKWVCTSDRFHQGLDFFFLGKENIVRVNDYEFDLTDFKQFMKDLLYFDHEVIYDDGLLYLAVFNNFTRIKHVNDIEDINYLIKANFHPSIEISDVAVFERERYNYGIKLDHHELRREFRNKK